MQGFIFTWQWRSILTENFALLYGSFTTNHDLAVALKEQNRFLSTYSFLSCIDLNHHRFLLRPEQSKLRILGRNKLTSFSIFFSVFPLGPIRSPTKLIAGFTSLGIGTLSLIRCNIGLVIQNLCFVLSFEKKRTLPN